MNLATAVRHNISSRIVALSQRLLESASRLSSLKVLLKIALDQAIASVNTGLDRAERTQTPTTPTNMPLSYILIRDHLKKTEPSRNPNYRQRLHSTITLTMQSNMPANPVLLNDANRTNPKSESSLMCSFPLSTFP